jgi:hypothetical protein
MIKRFALLMALILCAPAWGAVTRIENANFAADADPHADPWNQTTFPVHQVDDIILAMTIVHNTTETATPSAGWTTLAGFPAAIPAVGAGPAGRCWMWWNRADTTSETLSVDFGGTVGDAYYAISLFRGAVTTGDPFEVVGSPQSNTTVPVSLTGITTLTAGAMVIVWVMGNDNLNAAGHTVVGTDPASYTTVYADTAVGQNAMVERSEALRATAGATGTITNNLTDAIGTQSIVLALKDATAAASRRRMF